MCVGNFEPSMHINGICYTKSESDLFCIHEIFKSNVKIVFKLHNHLWNLCSSAVNLQRLLCGQKTIYLIRI